jgi:hypothetical protein
MPMKKVLIISPNFPPINAADMHRVRQSLPFFEGMGWKATVLAVKPEFVEMSQDPMLIKTIPDDSDVHYLKAFDSKYTRKFGLGNIGYRSLYFFLKAGNKLIRKNKYDLIYFSTTAFPVMVLGKYWKHKFGIPFIIDMQDPWRNDFYLDKPKNERPPKFWFAYRMDKYLEATTMKKVAGIVSVSPGYPKTLMDNPELFSKIRMFFVGTSYAADGKGLKTIEPIAMKFGVESQVIEITNRLPYFEALQVLKDSDILIIPGSTDTNYTASKLYPYILSEKPLIAVFNENSSVVEILDKTRAGTCATFANDEPEEKLATSVLKVYQEFLARIPFTPDTNWDEFEPYSAREATRKQVDFFNKILANS